MKCFTARGRLVLDLEKAVRMSAMDHRLKNEIAVSDGLPLLREAYDDALDGIVLPIIKCAISDHPKE